MLAAAARSTAELDLLATLGERIATTDPPPTTLAEVTLLLASLEEAALLESLVMRVQRPPAQVGKLQPPGHSQLSAADRQRARSAAYQRSASRQLREIGPLPPVQDPARRAACERDLQRYLKTYHPRAFPLDWSPAHLVLLKRAQLVITIGALFALAMARGTGKTTCCRHAVQWAINYGYARFPYLIGATDEKGEESLDVIRDDYETNPLLLADFPEICYPLHKLEGVHNKASGQILNGVPTRIKFRRRTLILPTVEGSAASGAILKTGGLLSSVRGANHKLPDGEIIRPDLILLDDPQTRESAESPQQSATRIRIVTADVLGMAGPTGKIAALMPCTVIAPGDLADTVLDPEKHPEWRPLRTSMLVSFPERLDLWEEYWDIFCAALKTQGDDEEFAVPAIATEFYKDHRKQMDQGGEVSWEARKRADELSALQHAMNLFFRNEGAFFSEYQNDPRDPFADEEFWTAPQIARKVTQYARGEVPLGCQWLTSFIDCHKRALVWMVCGWEWDCTGYVLDYGIFPEQLSPNWRMSRARPTLAMKYPKSGDAALYKGLQELQAALLQRTWKREDGTELQIDRGLIDQGYEAKTVQRVIRENKWHNLVYPCFGREIGPKQIPISQYKRRAGETLGEDWILKRSTSGKQRHLLFDVASWKTFAMRRLSQDLGEPGCVSLFGREPGTRGKPGRKADHDFLSRQLTAETRTVLLDGDRRVDQWRPKPASENHWFDCFVGCCVSASICGARIGGREEKQRGGGRSFSKLARRKRESQ